MLLRITTSGTAEARNEMLKLDTRLKRGSERLNVMKRIADGLADDIRRNLTEGNFTPLSPVTLEIRRRRGRGAGNKPLHATGALLASVKAQATEFVAEAAATKFYAGFVQLGFTTSPESAIPGKVVPGRPFMTISESRSEWAMDLILRWVTGEDSAAA